MLLIRWHGHSCFEIADDITIVTDPHDGKSIGIPTPLVSADIILVSHNHYDHNSVKTVEKEGTKIITDGRKRTIGQILIKGFPSYHDESMGERRGENIIYKTIIDDISFVHLGDLGHDLDDKTIESLEDIDILFIPVGGTYTIDAKKAWEIINKIKPRVTIPMHYKIEGLSLPIAPVDEFIEQSPLPVLRVGNEIDIEKTEIPSDPEVWVFTL
ncbi:MAG: MBL fold metallo-hydrolase [Candidatus Thermoplasmatota archaeon]|nr:MBL fold metallo-hydrolase [Candidatus Thermoplasmatota archaeon]